MILEQKELICKICYNNYDELTKLETCTHSFCKCCLSQYFQQIIDDNRTSLEHFKCPECNIQVNKNQFFDMLDEKHQQKYKELVQQKQEKQVQERELILFYIRNKQELSLCRCPWCGLITQKQNGCNFVRCYSPECEGKNVFCAQCDEELEDQDHNLHYEKGNPFGGRCRIKVDGKWVDRAKYFK